MTKRILIFSLLTTFYFSCEKATNTEERAVTKQPNILLLIGDDHGYADLSINELANDVQTPSLDALAAKSTRFVNAYASSPICSPSRVGLMTGTYQQRQGVLWYGGNGISDPNIPTVAELLSAKGYATGMVGKFHYGSKDGQTDNHSFPLNHGFQELFGFSGGRKHYIIHDNEKEAAFRKAMEQAENPKQSLKMEGFWEQDLQVKVEGFATEILGERGKDFMKKHLENNQPFFLTLSFNAVHNFTHQLPEEYLKANNLKGYRDWNPDIEPYYEWYENGRKPNNPEGRDHYLGQLHYLDKEIGKLYDFLEQEEQLENTIIIYIGDNGGSTQIYADNTPFNGGKYTMYEGGLRVPLMIAWKGKYQAQKVSKNLVSGLDILPTLCEAAKVEIPETVDGISLHSLLTGTDESIEHEALYWFGGSQAAVRSGKWKYRWAEEGEDSYAKSSTQYEGVALELGEYLYDLEADPSETQNRRKEAAEKFEELKGKMKAWEKETVFLEN
ncbi:MAG: sulfatase-like hydrolase/transferase [Bacteroidota bacterium]